MEQIYISYGQKSNAGFSPTGHGFCVRAFPFNSVDVTIVYCTEQRPSSKELNDDDIPLEIRLGGKVSDLLVAGIR
jgi:hypothetical protein